jgi:hypothetical protein
MQPHTGRTYGVLECTLPDHGIIIPLNAAVLFWQVPYKAAVMLSQPCEQAQKSWL